MRYLMFAHANAVATDIVAHTNAYAAIARPKCIIGVKNLVPFVHNQSGMRFKDYDEFVT